MSKNPLTIRKVCEIVFSLTAISSHQNINIQNTLNNMKTKNNTAANTIVADNNENTVVSALELKKNIQLAAEHLEDVKAELKVVSDNLDGEDAEVNYEFDKDIPVPAIKRPRKTGGKYAFLSAMKTGDSIFIPFAKKNTVQASIYQKKNSVAGKFRVRADVKDENEGVRVWRVA